MKVLALTIGNQRLASTRYRLGQFTDLLEGRKISLTLIEFQLFNDWKLLADYDLVILQKRLPRTSLIRRIRKHARFLIFDTDDAIWEPHGRVHSWWTRVRTHGRLRAITAAADACTVPNLHLANALQPLARQVHIIPMALDENEWKPAATRSPGPVRLGWSGAPPNLPYLQTLGDTLEEVQKLRPEVEIIVYCGKPPSWEHPIRSIHHAFEPGKETEIVQTFDIGLLPLPDNAFAAGKSPIKALQYAACGVPCVGTPIGATKEIVRDGQTGLAVKTSTDWTQALIRLIDNEDERHRLGDEARRQFLANHSRTKVLERLIVVWSRLTGNATS